LGRIVPDKGTHLAVEAAKKAKVPIVLAGTVDCHQPDSVRYYEEAVKPQIDDDQVKYIGPVNMEQKIELLSRARGFLNPIRWEEPFGMVMIEAMALGCPVISFTRGAASEIIVHRKTGFLVHDVKEMVQFIPRIDEIDRNAARMHVERNFSATAMATKYTKIYKKVILESKIASTRRYAPVPTGKALITPPPLAKTTEAVQLPSLAAQSARVTVEMEPKI
jgi:glycosyltransferase involved in cell wall biosynthesis